MNRAEAIAREVAKAPPPSAEVLELLRRLDCPIFAPTTADEGVAARACGEPSAATPDSAERGAA